MPSIHYNVYSAAQLHVSLMFTKLNIGNAQYIYSAAQLHVSLSASDWILKMSSKRCLPSCTSVRLTNIHQTEYWKCSVYDVYPAAQMYVSPIFTKLNIGNVQYTMSTQLHKCTSHPYSPNWILENVQCTMTTQLHICTSHPYSPNLILEMSSIQCLPSCTSVRLTHIHQTEYLKCPVYDVYPAAHLYVSPMFTKLNIGNVQFTMSTQMHKCTSHPCSPNWIFEMSSIRCLPSCTSVRLTHIYLTEYWKCPVHDVYPAAQVYVSPILTKLNTGNVQYTMSTQLHKCTSHPYSPNWLLEMSSIRCLPSCTCVRLTHVHQTEYWKCPGYDVYPAAHVYVSPMFTKLNIGNVQDTMSTQLHKCTSIPYSPNWILEMSSLRCLPSCTSVRLTNVHQTEYWKCPVYDVYPAAQVFVSPIFTKLNIGNVQYTMSTQLHKCMSNPYSPNWILEMSSIRCLPSCTSVRLTHIHQTEYWKCPVCDVYPAAQVYVSPLFTKLNIGNVQYTMSTQLHICSADPYQMQQNVASDKALNCLLTKYSIKI